MTAPHLLVCLSPHGFGHTAQTAPVVNALRRRIPALRFTLRTTVDPAVLRAFFDGDFALIPEATDFGMLMSSAVDVRIADSARAYADWHRDWPRRVDEEADRLTVLTPDLVLCNVPYLPLAGAQRAGFESAALCSLNWADIYSGYCRDRPEAAAIHAQMLEAYNAARVFIQPQPAMPMHDLNNRSGIGPIARIGRNRRDEVARRIGANENDRLILIAPGGIPMPIDMARWPRVPGTRYLVEAAWRSTHPDAVTIQSLGMPFPDVLASCDVFIGKPGYGSFAEAACNGIPMLYLPRGDWPEEPCLVDWLQRHGRCFAISRNQLEDGDFTAAIEQLLALPIPPRVAPAGIEQAAGMLADILTNT